MSQPQNIQWFPGHMAKTRRMIMEKLPIVDVVAEIIDARIPLSSRNPQLSQWIKNKPRIILLNKCDMADDAATKQWINHLNNETEVVLPIDCKSGKGLNRFLPSVKTILQSKLDALKAKGMGGRTLSVMVVGIPNVGKSSFINRLAGKNAAKVENRPGVTRGNQWFKVGSGVELMDTPGVLWPKFEDERVGEHLAFCGSIKDTVLDIESLAVRLLDILKKMYPRQLSDRYKLDFDVSAVDSFELLNEIGSRRGMKLSGSEVDTLRAATMLLEEFRNCKIGRFTIERP